MKAFLQDLAASVALCLFIGALYIVLAEVAERVAP